MAIRYYSKKEIVELLNISEDYFHRDMKKLIKKEFKTELAEINVDNPDILLDDDYNMYLANPKDRSTYFNTDVNIFDYTNT